jgi:Ohr subfamily peroxiredoxin
MMMSFKARTIESHSAFLQSCHTKYQLRDYIVHDINNLVQSRYGSQPEGSPGPTNDNPRRSPMPVKVLYRTQATATGGRDGKASTADGSFQVNLSTPKELGGGGGAGNNPEQLFAAGYSACFIGAMKAVSGQVGVKVPADATVTADVGIGPRSEGGFGLDVALNVSLPSLDRADAEKLVAAAHQVCPYSNATRGNIDVKLTVV